MSNKLSDKPGIPSLVLVGWILLLLLAINAGNYDGRKECREEMEKQAIAAGVGEYVEIPGKETVRFQFKQ